MKHKGTLGKLLLSSFLLLSGCGSAAVEETATASPSASAESRPTPVPAVNASYEPVNHSPEYGVWWSYIEYRSLCSEEDETAFRATVEETVRNMQDLGINTIYIHAVAFTDALYDSEIYPRSRYMPDTSYDPLAIFLEYVHAAGMHAEAWINPMRSVAVGEEDLLTGNNPIRGWIDENNERVRPVSGRWYMNPAYPEVRQLIVSVVQELLSKYELDGIHMDDYFYPSGTEKKFDAYVYSTAQKENPDLTLEAFRVANVDQLVKEIHDAVKEVNPSIRFGISPAGNNDNNHSLYYAYPEDWVAQGTVDYLIPQIYWGFLHPVKPYESTLQEWLKITEGSDVLLMPGLAAYSIGETYDLGSKKANREWVTNDDMLERQTAMALDTYGCSGVVYYSYSSLWAPTEDTKKIVENEIVHIKNYISSR